MKLRILKEWIILKKTMQYVSFQLKIEKSLRRALINTFSRKGTRRYQVEEGPWIEGSYYDMIRDIIFRRNGF